MAAPLSNSGPQKPDAAARPLSPHLTIYHWAPTMIVSIGHRATGIALSVGALVLAWWLIAISNGPEAFQGFYLFALSPLGLVVLFGLTWSLAFHFLQGLRHLAWDFGYGFAKQTARTTALGVIGLSLLIAAAVLAFVWTGHAGYLS
jgi:succinate dehydrogenase / fumarate reductase cytochrome b subunit